MARIRLARAAQYLGLPPLMLIQMAQGPTPVLTALPGGFGHGRGDTDELTFDEDEVKELKEWMNSNPSP